METTSTLRQPMTGKANVYFAIFEAESPPQKGDGMKERVALRGGRRDFG